MARIIQRFVHMLVTTAVCVVLTSGVATAQSPSPEVSGTDVFGNMPGVVWLLIPLALGGAYYLSRELGCTDEPEQRTSRQGAVSKALTRQERDEI